MFVIHFTNIRYHNTEKVKMSQLMSKRQVLPLKALASQIMSVSHAKELDLAYLNDISTQEDCPEHNGYNTKLSREQGHTTRNKTKADDVPLIDMKPSDPDIIMTAITKAQVYSSKYAQNFTVFTGDLQLYTVAVKVIWAYRDQFCDVVLRLGGMHFLLNFVGSIGSLMANSGFEEILASTFAGVPKLLNGKKFPQNMRALRIVTEELLRKIFQRSNFQRFDDLQAYLDNVVGMSRTSKLWIDCLVILLLLRMMYVRAEREADWPFHLASVEKMIPYFFAAGHYNYARYGLYYLRDMQRIPADVLDKFMKGEHVMRHQEGTWNGIWSDMFIETTFMRYGHGKKGIVGITLNPDTLKVWSLSLHICSQMENDLKELTDSDSKTNEKHKEEGKSRIHDDIKDRECIRKKLDVSTDPLDPSGHPEGIINVVSGVVAPENVNVDRSLGIATGQMRDFEQSWPENFHKTISKKVEAQAITKKHAQVDDTEVYDTELIYSRVIGLQASNRDADINRTLTHELAGVPTSMFNDKGVIRVAKNKSKLKTKFKVELSERLVNNRITCTIIDGSVVLYVIHCPTDGTVSDYVDDFQAYIEQKLKSSDVYLVFDRYYDYSTKSVTRSGRQTEEASRIYQLTEIMELPAQKVILGVTENKQQLISIVCKKLITDTEFHNNCTQSHRLIVTGEEDTPIEIYKGVRIPRTDLKTTHEEADVIMIRQMYDAVESNHKGITVIVDDTDVFVLLIYYYIVLGLSILLTMESPVKERTVIDIGKTALKHKDIAREMLPAHAISGCDTVAAYYHVSKGKMAKALEAGQSIRMISDLSNDEEKVIEQATNFVSVCYGNRPGISDMSVCRQRVWAAKVAKAGKIIPKLATLPPTTECFTENVKRAHHQALIWRHALDLDPAAVDPCEYGWYREDKTKTLQPVTEKAKKHIAPPNIMKLIKCGYTSARPCSTMRCTCDKAKLPCTLFCGCQKSQSDCCNELTKKV